MSKISIYSSALAKLATLNVASSAMRSEKINAGNTLEFSAAIKNAVAAYINDTNVVELDGDYFDIAAYKKEQPSNGYRMVSVECEHVSYRLNDPDYDMDYFTQTGTPTAILTALLSGTGFTVGTVEFASSITYSAQEAKSRRALLMELVATLEGEVEFSGFAVSILTQRGSATPKVLVVGKDITVLSKSVNKRTRDESGNPIVSYACGVYKPDSLALGDIVTLGEDDLDIDVSLRIVGIAWDPYNPRNMTIEVGNYVNALENDLYRIETTTVVKDKTYYGTRIGPEYGFESIRSDNMSRTIMNADTFAMQAGDGSGTLWVDKVWFDPATDTYKFTGTLVATNGVFMGSVTIGDDENSILIDQFGMDTKFIKWFKNMCQNSSFELYDETTLIPLFWSGGVSSPSANFFGSYSLKLEPAESSTADAVNSTFYDSVSDHTRVSFHKKGGAVTISVLDGDNADAPFTLTRETGATGTEIEYASNVNWVPGSYTVSFAHGSSTKIKVKFENSDGAADAYIDGVIIEPDYTGKRPSFYTDGPNSSDGTIRIISEETSYPVTPGAVQWWVETDFPSVAKDKDCLADIDNPTSADGQVITTATVLTWADPECLTVTGTTQITLPNPTADKNIDGEAVDHDGIVYFEIHNDNAANGMVTVIVASSGTINGVSSLAIWPRKTRRLRTGVGANWEVC